jgi:hypothetical protein
VRNSRSALASTRKRTFEEESDTDEEDVPPRCGGGDSAWYSRGVVLTPTPPPHGFVTATHRKINTKKKAKLAKPKRAQLPHDSNKSARKQARHTGAAQLRVAKSLLGKLE